MVDAGIHITSPTRGRTASRPAPEAISLLNRRRSRLIALGAVNLFRTVTGQQLAAITGQPGLASLRSYETGILFSAALIQRGRFHYANKALNDMPEIFRPDTKASDVNLRQHLRYADWIGVTFGGPLMSGHQYDRHNLLAVELSLRAAEICPLRSVLGEALATWPRLFSPSLSPNPHRSSDALFVRDDGLKIAVEITATLTTATVKKIDQLAELLARDTSRSVVFLFVLAAQPGSDHELEVGRRLRQAIKKSSHSSRSRILAEVEKRMVVAKWTDLFPAPGLVSREFVRLRSQRYAAAEDDWIDTDLLDPFDVKGEADSLAVAETDRNLNDVYGAPWWMRTGPGFNFDAYLLERAGFDRVLEIKAKSDRERRKGQ
jgi:hypothetical protein